MDVSFSDEGSLLSAGGTFCSALAFAFSPARDLDAACRELERRSGGTDVLVQADRRNPLMGPEILQPAFDHPGHSDPRADVLN